MSVFSPSRISQIVATSLLGVFCLLLPLAASGQNFVEFSNSQKITIPSGTGDYAGPVPAKASPYPSEINVSGLSGMVREVAVDLMGFSHTAPIDVVIVLVSPSGKAVTLTQLAGGGASTNLSNAQISFAQTGRSLTEYAFVNGTSYYPGYFTSSGGYANAGAINMPSPCPSNRLAYSLNDLLADNPNGSWKLFVMDWWGGDSGSINLGWKLRISIDQPPKVLTQPATQTINQGENFSLSISASGSSPLAYQWQKNGVNILGATASTYSKSSAAPSDSAFYTCLVSNPFGSASSTPAQITVNSLPTLSVSQASYSLGEDSEVVGIPITFGDLETALSGLVVSATSSNTALFPNASLLQRNGNTVTLKLSPAANASGSATISVKVSDGIGQMVVPILVTVNSENDAPVVSAPGSLSINEDAVGALAATVSDVETAPGSLVLTVASSNTALIDSSDITITTPSGSAGQRSLSLRPKANAFGTATLTLTLSDGAASATRQVSLIVSPVNDAPALAIGTSSVQLQKNTSSAPIAISLSDVDNDPASLTVSTATSNSALLPLSALALAGSGTSRTLTVTPAADGFGSGTVTVSVSDGQFTDSKQLAVTVFSGPAITVQPVGGERLVGQSIALTVAATGSPSPTYQWRKTGSPISGQTGTTLTLGSLTAASAATYDVVVTNSVGSVTSDPAVVQVRQPVAIISHPASLTRASGGSATFNVGISGSGNIAYQWLKGGVDIPSENAASLTISPLTLENSGSYSVRVTNGLSTVTSNAAALTVMDVPQITAQPVGEAKLVGSSIVLSASASGSTPLTYQWKKDGANVSGGSQVTLSLTNLSAAQAGNYTLTATNAVGSATSSPAYLQVLTGVSISSHPQNALKGVGGSHTFSVTATGGGALTYQWFKAGQAISGASQSTLALSDLQDPDSASYTVSVSNGVSTVLSNAATLQVQIPPSVTLQPVAQTVPAESSAKFSVSADGTAPLTYQWKKDGANVSGSQFAGATSETLNITGVAGTDAGNYTCTVTNAVGNASSLAAALTVAPAVATEWEWVYPLPEGNDFKGSAFLGGIWVVLTNKDTLLRTSDEGTIWNAMSETDLAFNASGTWNQILTANGKFLLVGGDENGNARIWSSTNGLDWQIENIGFPPNTKKLRNVTVNGSVYLAQEDNGRLLNGTGLANWSTVTGNFTWRSNIWKAWQSDFYSPKTLDYYLSGLGMEDAGSVSSLTVSVTSGPGLHSCEVSLISPDGTKRVLGNLPPNANVVFSDDASQSLDGVPQPQSGTYRPRESLTAFAEKAVMGLWKLELRLPAGSGIGAIRSAEVRIKADQLAVPRFTYIVPDGSGFSSVGYYQTSDSSIGQTEHQSYFMRSVTGDTWTFQYASGLLMPHGLAFDGMRFVTSSNDQSGGGAVLSYSSNGTSWTQAQSPTTTTPENASPVTLEGFSAPKFLNGQFVVPAYAGAVWGSTYTAFAVSSDGINWSSANNPALGGEVFAFRPDDINYAGGKYRIASRGPNLALGTGLTNLESKLSGPVATLANVKAVPSGDIWAVGQNNLVLKSANGGESWTKVHTGQPSTTNWTSVVGGLGKVLLLNSNANGFFVTEDGITFQNINAFNPSTPDSVVFTGAKFVAFRYDGAVSESSDALTWSPVAAPIMPVPNVRVAKPVYYNGKYYAIGRNPDYTSQLIFVSLDGNQWAQFADFGRNAGLTGVLAAGNGRLIAIRSGGVASVDLASGTTSNVPVSGIGVSSEQMASFGYNNFVVVSAGKLFTSPDGLVWQERHDALPPNPGLNSLTYGPNRFFAVGYGGTILRSQSEVVPAPEILSQPVSKHVLEGEGVTLSVDVLSSNSEVTYQWFKNGQLIPGQTASTLSFAAVALSDDGSYHVRISGAGGTSSSEPAVVSVPSAFALGFQPGAGGGGNWERACHVNGEFLLFGSSLMARSFDGVDYAYSNFPLTGSSYNHGAAVGNGKLVVSAQTGKVAIAEGNGPLVEYSTSGSSMSGGMRLAFGAGRFVGVVQGATRSSPEGLVWTLHDSIGGNDVCFDGTQFVCVGNSGTIRTSPDGINWTARTSGVTAALNRVVKSGSLWVVAGSHTSYSSVSQTTVLTSPDGITWTRKTMPSGSLTTSALASGPSGLVLLTTNQAIWRGDVSATTWTGVTINDPDLRPNDVVHGNGTYMIVGDYGIVYSSTTTLSGSWSRRLPSLPFQSIADVVFSNGKYSAIVQQGTEIRLQESLDGLSWTQKTAFGNSTTNNINRLAAGSTNGNLVAAGSNTAMRYSTNSGGNWTNSTVTPANLFFGEIAFLNGSFYAVANRRIYRSTDMGATFTGIYDASTYVEGAQLTDIVYGNGRYIAYGKTAYNGATLYATSGNGTVFLTGTSPGFEEKSLVFGNGVFLGKTGEASLLRSEDGVIWTTIPAPFSYGTLSFQNGMFIHVGTKGVAYSANGLTWKHGPLVAGLGSESIRVVAGPNQALAFSSSGLLRAPFTSSYFTISSTPVGNGAISPAPPQIVAPGGSLVFSSSTSSLWRNERWKVDGIVAQVLGETFTLSNIQSNKTVAAEFEEKPRLPAWTQNLAASGFIAEGGNLTFTVAVNAFPAASLQWFKNDIAIPGETGTSLYISDVRVSDQAAYKVVATNPVGSITSNIRELDVQYSPKLGPLPESLSVSRGETFELALEVDADPLPVTYQWLRDGVNIAGATQATFKFSNYQPHMSGNYSVLVTNARGSFASSSISVAGRIGDTGAGKAGSLDKGFRPVSNSGVGSACENVFPRAGGGFLLVGFFVSTNENGQAGVTALTADGQPDLTYTPDFEIETGGKVWDSARQPDGKILIAGPFVIRKNGQVFTRGLARLNSDGSLDTTLQQSLAVSGSVYTLALAPNRSIYLGGVFTSFGGTSRKNIARFSSSGALDSGFTTASGGPNSDVYALLPLADGSVLVGGWFTQFHGNAAKKYLVKLTGAGALDASFTQLTFGAGVGTTGVNCMALQPDGKIMIAGNWASLNSLTHGTRFSDVARINPDGTLDPEFNPGAASALNSAAVNQVQIESDGKILINGNLSGYGSTSPVGDFIRLNANGTLDSGFSTVNGSADTVYGVLPLSGGYLAVGTFETWSGVGRDRVAKISSSGILDSTFGTATGTLSGSSPVLDIATQPGGSILLAGSFTTLNNTNRQYLAKLDSQGRTDSTFTGPALDNYPTRLAAAPDGKYYLAGYFSTVSGNALVRLARIHGNGTVDLAFAVGTGFNSDINSLAPAPGGKLYVGGGFTSYQGTSGRARLVRLNPDGSFDSTFSQGTGFNSTVNALLVQPDGKVLVAGAFGQFNGTAAIGLARLNADGSRDAGFSFASVGAVKHIALTPTGLIYAAGSMSSVNGQAVNGLVRLNADGSLDPTFAPATGVYSSSYPASLSVQPDGRLVLANGTVKRLESDGSLDSGFFSGLFDNYAYTTLSALQLTTAGKFLVGGSFSLFNGVRRVGLAQLHGDSVPVAPEIISQPWGDFAPLGGRVVLSVVASGYPLPTYQWQKGESPVPGATSSQLVLDPLAAEDAGSYRVIVSNALGAVTSESAPVTTNTKPTIEAIANQLATIGTHVGPLPFAVGDAQTASSLLLVTATSSNTGLISSGGIVLGGMGSSRNVSLTPVPDAVGDADITLTVSDGLLTSSASFRISFASVRDAWFDSSFSLAQQQEPTISGMNADPDRDGAPNVLEYAFGNDPMSPGQENVPEVDSMPNGDFVFSYPRPSGISDVTYNILSSRNLTTWTSHGPGSRVSTNDETETWQVILPKGSGNAFFRVNINVAQ